MVSDKMIARLVVGSLTYLLFEWLYDLWQNGLPTITIPWDLVIAVLQFVIGAVAALVGFYVLGYLLEKLLKIVFSTSSEGENR